MGMTLHKRAHNIYFFFSTFTSSSSPKSYRLENEEARMKRKKNGKEISRKQFPPPAVFPLLRLHVNEAQIVGWMETVIHAAMLTAANSTVCAH